MRFNSLLWLCALAFGGGLISIASAYLQRAGLSPIVLYSLMVGAACGAVAVVLAIVFDVRDQKFLLAGTFVMAALVVASQHVVLHRLQLHNWQKAQRQEPQLVMFKPPPPEELLTYLRQESAGGRAWLWLLDAVIVIGIAVGIAAGVRRDSSPSKMESS